MMICGLCGSGVCADEKFKKLKDGSVNRHIYYGCTRVRDKSCKCGYINESDLIKQFEDLIENINIDEISIKEKIKDELTRFKKFQAILLGKKEETKVENVDIKNYAKFILKNGSDIEKRELISCFRGKIVLENKIIKIN